MAIDRRVEALALYRTMPTDDLQRLRVAFTLDRHATTSAESHAFIDTRIALIDQVLAARSEQK